jgi:hypothetical protein
MLACLGLLAARPAVAQPAAAAARAFGRVSFFTNAASTRVEDLPRRSFGEFTTSVTYRSAEQAEDGVEFAVDFRHSGYSAAVRPQRISIYEGFVGARLSGGRVVARAGQLWLSDLGALGSVAGGSLEVRQGRDSSTPLGRLRFGAFGGLEPRVYEARYVPGVRKFGGYLAVDGDRGRRHVVGLVDVRHASLTERSVVTTANFLPVGRKFFLYQAAEYDVRAPSGQGRAGLAYLFANVRVSPTNRVDLQGTYNRGRSVDTRGLADDILSGRPLKPSTIEGLLYESVGGRATVEVVRRVRVYAGYSRDKTNRDAAPTGRTTIGGFAANVFGSGFDVTGSDALLDGTTRRYHSRYVSVGRQVRRSIYLSGDYSTSLSVIHFSRSDGLIIEMKPKTRRMSGNAVWNLGRSISILAMLDRTVDDQARELRVLSGITYRLR